MPEALSLEEQASKTGKAKPNKNNYKANEQGNAWLHHTSMHKRAGSFGLQLFVSLKDISKGYRLALVYRDMESLIGLGPSAHRTLVYPALRLGRTLRRLAGSPSYNNVARRYNCTFTNRDLHHRARIIGAKHWITLYNIFCKT